MLEQNKKKTFHLRLQEYNKIYGSTIDALKDLTYFTRNQLVFLSQDEEFNEPNLTRQNILKEQGLMEVLTGILK